MFLALSARMFERRTGYELGFEDLAALATEVGYDGLELRRRQVNETSKPADIARVHGILRRHNVRCSQLTAAGLETRAAVDDATRLLAVALALECRLVRVQLVRDDEVAFARELADRAAERGMRLMSQIHSGSLFADVEMALNTLGKIGRDNFGVAFEASQLMFAGQEHGEGAVRSLGGKIFACLLEAHKPAPAGSNSSEAIIISGRPWLPAIPGEEGSADIASVFHGLKAVGFQGPTVVSCARHPEVPSRELAAMWRDYARKAMAEAGLG
jgi:sugar phosphate isomerase/epimerase